MRSILAFLIFAVTISGAYAAEDMANSGTKRQWLGKARLWSNDEIGDRRDRWRTGSYSLSYIRGTGWNGRLPGSFGDLVEYRIRGEVIAPASLYAALDPADRRLVGVLQVGAFTHMRVNQTDVSLGLDLVFTGPQSRMAEFQSAIHQSLGFIATPILGSQLGNAVYPTLNAEASRQYRLSTDGARRVVFRPFLEGQLGVETYIRAGGDFTFGNLGEGDFQVRDVTTGQRNVALKGNRTRGVSFILGGDVAYVQSSQYLPAALGPAAQKLRYRLRTGIYAEDERKSLFYGVTWLGREFQGQSSGQILGSVTLRLKF
ncbi:MAG: lipid A deacylase LpxR family protein [Alphaproteobacteria bacterium]|nr:lipid A deacylase LpxR family protein [Alphaproteobacteria bacterium]